MQPRLKVEYMATGELAPYANNARLHDDAQVEEIAASIDQFGFSDPVGVWTRPDGVLEIVEGHGRVMAAKRLGLERVPVIRLDHLDDEGRRAYSIVHNKTTDDSSFDLATLEREMGELVGFDWSEFGFDDDIERGHDDVEADRSEREREARASLRDTYIVPPLSVLDARQGYWQERKRAWNEIIGDASETRDGEYGTIGDGGILRTINGGTSNFDPVLAETMMTWFNRPGGKVLDPFGGEQTKGIVAGELGLEYHGVEIREDQVALNRERTKGYATVHYYQGDSNMIDEIVPERGFDLCFTSPPYYDLEVYSKEDMSALGTYDEFMAQYRNIFQRCYDMLADEAFLVVKVGEIRDKKTGVYRSFVPDNVRVMTDIGFKYYNELILVTAIGTACVRASVDMRTRNVTKTHQNILVFYKGNPEKTHENILVFFKGNPKAIPSSFPRLGIDFDKIPEEAL